MTLRRQLHDPILIEKILAIVTLFIFILLLMFHKESEDRRANCIGFTSGLVPLLYLQQHYSSSKSSVQMQQFRKSLPG